jgi:hypothetical protein
MSELQVTSKVETNCTYSKTANYWAPLSNFSDDDDDDDDHSDAQAATVNNISDAEVQRDLRSTILAWINQRMGKHRPFQRRASTMVVDSGATSSFVRPEENLPITGPSSKIVNLPDGSAITATHTTMLPFESLSTEARKADVLPGIRNSHIVDSSDICDQTPMPLRLGLISYIPSRLDFHLIDVL